MIEGRGTNTREFQCSKADMLYQHSETDMRLTKALRFIWFKCCSKIDIGYRALKWTQCSNVLRLTRIFPKP